jgi:hypothetical protein
LRQQGIAGQDGSHGSEAALIEEPDASPAHNRRQRFSVHRHGIDHSTPPGTGVRDGDARQDFGLKRRAVIPSKAPCFAGGRIIWLRAWGFSQNRLLNQPGRSRQEPTSTASAVVGGVGSKGDRYLDAYLLAAVGYLLE